ncbi:MAG: hypothetical protein IIB03_02090 [Acidobacteria bacterium]|nr:hypothetical protein [Acidobacteriota bacterium]
MESKSRNEIARHIQEGIEKGRYRDCIHLDVIGGGEWGGEFREYCKNDAFEWEHEHFYPYRRSNFFCPKDCLYFESRLKVERREKREKRRRSARFAMAELKETLFRFHWVERLVFLLIILLVVAWLIAPEFVPLLIELAKAVFGAS